MVSTDLNFLLLSHVPPRILTIWDKNGILTNMVLSTRTPVIRFSPIEMTVNNMVAERAIGTIIVQRSVLRKCKWNTDLYNTFIETRKQLGGSFMDYFCKLLRELKKGRTDYENLLPMTIVVF